ncbi:MAG: isochorismatase [Actinomycetota bacterium]|nr:isochorismatase [Actinomycetota bacterium]
MRGLPIPPFFEPERVGDVWRVPYEERAADAVAWAREHEVAPAADDAFRICLVAVDVQNTFCTPGFELVVPGAVDDNRRLCEFVYRNLGALTRIVPTLDTHQALQIFHAAWLVDEHGGHPPPYTIVSAEDVERGIWRANPAVARSLGLDEEYAERQLLDYVRSLERGGKFALTIWPYHAMLGGIGHALVSVVEEAFFFHTVARESQADYRLKGRNPLTEHYSLLGPEVTEGPAGERIGEKDTALVEELLSYDAVVVAGQAKSHCVAWTVDDLLAATGGDRRLTERVYLLEDCSSPVVVPGAVDFTDDANAAYARFAEAGMHVVRSTEPLETWPGLADVAAAR